MPSLTAFAIHRSIRRLSSVLELIEQHLFGSTGKEQLIGSEKIWERGAALTLRLQSFATEVLCASGSGPAGVAGMKKLRGGGGSGV